MQVVVEGCLGEILHKEDTIPKTSLWSPVISMEDTAFACKHLVTIQLSELDAIQKWLLPNSEKVVLFCDN